MTLNIGGVAIGGENPCRFVAEISNNHNGDFGRALRLIDAAKDAGADLVKFQCYTPDELVQLRGGGAAPYPWGEQGWSMRALYEKAQTPHEWFPALVLHCKQVGIPWFSSVFGTESLALLEQLECPALKVARLDNKDTALRGAVHATGKPLVVSDGDANWISSPYLTSSSPKIFLWCPAGYPQTRFGFGRRIFGEHPTDYGYDGFSFHGTDYTPCIVAAALGAKVIEAHFQLDNEPSELEANVSLGATQFRAMIRDVRRVEEMLA